MRRAPARPTSPPSLTLSHPAPPFLLMPVCSHPHTVSLSTSSLSSLLILSSSTLPLLSPPPHSITLFRSLLASALLRPASLYFASVLSLLVFFFSPLFLFFALWLCSLVPSLFDFFRFFAGGLCLSHASQTHFHFLFNIQPSNPCLQLVIDAIYAAHIHCMADANCILCDYIWGMVM